MRFPRLKAESQSFTTAFQGWSTVDSFSRLPIAVELRANNQSFIESHFYNLKEKLGYRLRRTGTPLTALGCSDTLWVFRDLRVRPDRLRSSHSQAELPYSASARAFVWPRTFVV
jgi:hypothetical protein